MLFLWFRVDCANKLSEILFKPFFNTLQTLFPSSYGHVYTCKHLLPICHHRCSVRVGRRRGRQGHTGGVVAGGARGRQHVGRALVMFHAALHAESRVHQLIQGLPRIWSRVLHSIKKRYKIHSAYFLDKNKA